MSKKSEDYWDWYRHDKLVFEWAILFIFISIVIIGMHVFIYLQTNNFISMFSSFFAVGIVLFIFSIIMFIGYLQYRKMAVKLFSFDNQTTTKVIENALHKKNINYTEMKNKGLGSKFPIKFSNIYKILNYDLIIKVRKGSFSGTVVLLGPVNRENGSYNKKLRKILNKAFEPRGLYYN